MRFCFLLIILTVVSSPVLAQVPDSAVLVDRAPEPTQTVSPVYPDSARRVGLEGRVHVRVRVLASGEARDVSVLRSDHALFDSSAVQAVRQWRFRPAERGGQPVEAWVTIPIRFRTGAPVPSASTPPPAPALPPLPTEPIVFSVSPSPRGYGPAVLADSGRCGVMTPPRIVQQVRPDYPERERGRGGEGEVTMRLHIGTDGRVRDVAVVSMTRSTFGVAATRAARAWTFEPATCTGRPVEAFAPLTIRFRSRTNDPAGLLRLPDHVPGP